MAKHDIGMKVSHINLKTGRETQTIFACTDKDTMERVIEIERNIPVITRIEFVPIYSVKDVVCVGNELRPELKVEIEGKDGDKE